MALTKAAASTLAAEALKSLLANPTTKFHGPNGSSWEAPQAAEKDAQYLTTLHQALTRSILIESGATLAGE